MSPRVLMMALCSLLVSGATSGVCAQEAQEPAPDREITQLRDDLYRVRDGQQYTVFLATPDGIILGDPLNRPAALWLQEELAARFPGSSVRFVLQSHHHVERAEGASVFNRTAELVGHGRFNPELAASRRAMPDRYRFARNVESTYESRRVIMLGGRTAELVHPGSFHSPDMTVLYFPRERVVFAVDPPPVTAVPFSFGSLRPRDVLDWIHAVAPLDFDTLLFGGGETATRSELVALGDYLDSLREGVTTGYEQGQSLAQLQVGPLLAAYRAGPHYAARAAQTAAVYRALRLIRLEMSGAAIANYGRRDSGYCTPYAFCVAGGAVPAGTAAVALLLGRGPGVVGELTLGAQSWSSRTRPLFDEEVALRKSRAAALFRYSPPREGTLSYAVLGGVSQTVGDARGMNRVQGVLLPVGGRHAIAARVSKTGMTFGIDVARTTQGRLSVVVPIRVTRIVGQLPRYWPGKFEAYAGVGISMRVLRRTD